MMIYCRSRPPTRSQSDPSTMGDMRADNAISAKDAVFENGRTHHRFLHCALKKPGRRSTDVAPAPAIGTAGLELVGAAEGVAAARKHGKLGHMGDRASRVSRGDKECSITSDSRPGR
jgi:hypothetical protein